MSKKQNCPTEATGSDQEYSQVFAKLVAEEQASSESDAPDTTTADTSTPDHEYSSVFAKLAAEERATAESDEDSDESLAEAGTEPAAADAPALVAVISAAEPVDIVVTASLAELKPAIEAILFVADEPVNFNLLCKILGDVNAADVRTTLIELMTDYETRDSGLELREIAGGWRISTRPQHHEFIRNYLKSKPSARLSLPALETLAVVAYKQPVTVPEILEIRGVSSTSAIKTLLEKRLIVTKGRKETVGRPMMYGTSKEFLIQFGLRDLNELPSIEDFEELAG